MKIWGDFRLLFSFFMCGKSYMERLIKLNVRIILSEVLNGKDFGIIVNGCIVKI